MEQKEASGAAHYEQSKQPPVEEKTLSAEGVLYPRVHFQRKLRSLLALLGPGFLSGMAGNDATGITMYAIDGATAGYGHLWLLLLTTPMYQAVQFACASIGRVTQMGLADNLRKHYGCKVALLVVSILVIANVALIAGDLVAIGSGLELLTGISWAWFVIPVAIVLWYLIVHHSFEMLTRIFSILSLAFVTYLITAVFSGANWEIVLRQTFMPQLHFDLTDLGAAVALLGATISPYSMFWQADGEREQRRPGSTRQQMRCAAFDVASGVISGNFIAYGVIVTTAATLFVHHHSIQTAADAARALAPLLGPLAKYLFAIGLIGAGFIAIPVLLASTSYAVAGACGWPSGLSKRLWQHEGIEFYLILTGALIVSLALALLHVDPIQLILWANVLVGILAPMLVIVVIVVGNNRMIMRSQPLGRPTSFFLVLTVIVLLVAATLFFYGLLTGNG
ncbi:MAG TPA: divalent metal cation transporter [Ktedonobacteraceae bacterium]|nr:divalent metal cation transporter [Ktedonobacteraceae bacterium]